MIKIYSSRTYHEFKTFIWHNGKPQAMRYYNDDLVMALAIACWVRDTALETNKRDVEYSKAMLGGIFMKSTKMNTAIKGMDGHPKNIEKQIKQLKKRRLKFLILMVMDLAIFST